jgi:hypothetical protein
MWKIKKLGDGERSFWFVGRCFPTIALQGREEKGQKVGERMRTEKERERKRKRESLLIRLQSYWIRALFIISLILNHLLSQI